MMIMCNGTKFNNNSNNNINEVKSEERNEMEWSEKKWTPITVLISNILFAHTQIPNHRSIPDLMVLLIQLRIILSSK